MGFESRYAESSTTSKTRKADENGAGMENLSEGTRMASDVIPSNSHEWSQCDEYSRKEKVAFKQATVTVGLLTKKPSHLSKQRFLEIQKLTLDR